ncbi:MAG: hypothetical protein M3497_05410 [Gemmatimonadota bacterium]|nr:hypothetical protein [Gemmatimonadota bacterium]
MIAPPQDLTSARIAFGDNGYALASCVQGGAIAWFGSLLNGAKCSTIFPRHPGGNRWRMPVP